MQHQDDTKRYITAEILIGRDDGSEITEEEFRQIKTEAMNSLNFWGFRTASNWQHISENDLKEKNQQENLCSKN